MHEISKIFEATILNYFCLTEDVLYWVLSFKKWESGQLWHPPTRTDSNLEIKNIVYGSQGKEEHPEGWHTYVDHMCTSVPVPQQPLSQLSAGLYHVTELWLAFVSDGLT